jgi:hypothetical protein
MSGEPGEDLQKRWLPGPPRGRAAPVPAVLVIAAALALVAALLV